VSWCHGRIGSVKMIMSLSCVWHGIAGVADGGRCLQVVSGQLS